MILYLPGTATGSVHHCGEGSVGPPSTCNGDYNWGNTTASSVDNGSTASCGGCNQGGPATSHHGHLPHYMSSAMSTSSVDSGSASGSGSRGYSGSGGSAAGSGGGGGLGSRRPSQLRSFNIPNPPVVGQTPFGKIIFNFQIIYKYQILFKNLVLLKIRLF